MAEPRTFASLSSGLLARKGSAKPAMRPQGFGQGMGLEDLGWNDMGQGQQPAASVFSLPLEDRPEHVPSSISALTPAPRSPIAEEPAAPPPVAEQHRAIEAAFAGEPKPEVSQAQPTRSKAQFVKLPSRPRNAPGAKGRAAFTLRLDPDRHLRLRLACAVTHRSAQQLVSEALDTFLASLPELDAVVEQVPASLGKRG